MEPILLGSKDVFAIQFCISLTDGRALYGHFVFWIDGQCVGNSDDMTMISACFNWTKDFLDKKIDRSLAISPVLNFQELYEQLHMTIYGADSTVEASMYYDAHYSITHMGMSSFDRYNVFLIENQDDQIIIWHDRRDNVTGGAVFPRETMQHVCAQFVAAYPRAVHDFMSQYAME